MFDATGSLIDYGDTWIDRAAYQFPPALSDIFRGAPPLTDAAIEPMQMIAASPLYALATIIPGLGTLHVVWTFNALITAAIGAVFFAYALALGYDERTAAVGALLLGAATILVPYAKTFFREPLTALLLLTAALCLERLRGLRYRSAAWGLGAIIAIGALALTKASSLLALPALIAIALPPIRHVDRRTVLVFGAASAVLVGVFLIFGVADIVPALSGRYSIFGRLAALDWTNFGTAVAAYLISPGGSLWGTSPVLLLTIPGALLLVAAGRVRMLVVGTIALLAFAGGYAALNGAFWFGGLSWPPRFLVPIVPLVWTLALPVAAALTRRSRWWLIAAPLIAYSLSIQLAGVLTFWADYADALPAEANRFVDWVGGLYDPRYFRWTLLPTLLAQHPPDLAWWVTNAPIWPISMAAVAVGGLVGLATRRRWVYALVPALIGVAGLNLGRLYQVDARYLAADDSLHRAYAVLQTETRPDDVILLSSPRYASFFLNDAPRTGAMGRVIALPFQPGDRPSPEEAPQIEAENPAALLIPETAAWVNALAAEHDRLWLIVNGSPDLWWSVRPVERYLSTYFYPLRVIVTGENTRLLEYATVPAPDPYARRGPSIAADLVYGDALRLIGVELPTGSVVRPGAAAAVSLAWQTETPVTANYTIALFVRRPDGSELAQTDWQPMGGFAPTSGWIPGVPVWDHRALRLPTDLPPGDYPLWVKVYDFSPNGERRDLPVTAGTALDGAIGVLPVSLTVPPA